MWMSIIPLISSSLVPPATAPTLLLYIHAASNAERKWGQKVILIFHLCLSVGVNAEA